MVFACDECDSVWLDPENIKDSKCIDTRNKEHYIPDKDCYVSKQHGAEWATIDEIKKAGLEKYIKGESSPL